MSKLNIPGVETFEGENKGLNVTVLAGVHGSEFAAGRAVQDEVFRNVLLNGVRNGTLNLGIGNLEAVKKGKRFVDRDLNRCFGTRDGEARNSEERRADELKPLLRRTDVLLDVHATSKPSNPFVVVPKIHDKLAACVRNLGIKTIIAGHAITPPLDKTPTGLRRGPVGPTDPVHTATYVDSQGGVGITIESGHLESPDVERVVNGVLASLVELEIFGPEVLEGRNIPELEALDVYDSYLKLIPGPNFRFAKEWGNFEEIADGETVAYEGDIAISAEDDSFIVFPKRASEIVVGEECGILLRRAAEDKRPPLVTPPALLGGL